MVKYGADLNRCAGCGKSFLGNLITAAKDISDADFPALLDVISLAMELGADANLPLGRPRPMSRPPDITVTQIYDGGKNTDRAVAILRALKDGGCDLTGRVHHVPTYSTDERGGLPVGPHGSPSATPMGGMEPDGTIPDGIRSNRGSWTVAVINYVRSAIERDWAPVLQFALTEGGVDPDAILDGDVRNYLRLAVTFFAVECTAVLLAAGADPTLVDPRTGETALDVALRAQFIVAQRLEAGDPSFDQSHLQHSLAILEMLTRAGTGWLARRGVQLAGDADAEGSGGDTTEDS